MANKALMRTAEEPRHTVAGTICDLHTRFSFLEPLKLKRQDNRALQTRDAFPGGKGNEFLGGKSLKSTTNEHKKGTISGCELDLQVDSSQLVPPLQGLVHHMHTLPLCKTTLFVTQALLLFYFFLPQLVRHLLELHLQISR
uniref:Uncharacterized protein n=1 Tax=Coccidioides posadasii RMSCC 3488 TaxID=454284 RepID=A0A0J6FIM4_COCPO|nr:hypothetical protein CPAG_05566 [Coccidioides posadasii RMSCC 3488]